MLLHSNKKFKIHAYIHKLPSHPSNMISAKPVHKSANLTCSVCGKHCKRLWSLSYHKRSKHGLSTGVEVCPDIQVFPDVEVPDIEVQTHKLLSLYSSVLLLVLHQSLPCHCPPKTAGPQRSDSESGISDGSVPSEGSDFQDDSDAVDDDSDCELVSDDVSSIQDTDLDDDILLHPHGGQIHDIEVNTCPAFHIQEKHHCDKGHPYHLWKTVNEVSVTNLVYAKAHMTMAATNTLLGGFKNGVMKMDGLGFHSSRAMHKILGAADYVPVCDMQYKTLRISDMYIMA